MLANNITVGEKYGRTTEITTQEEADAYFELCVEHSMRVANFSRKKAEEVERSNIGYFAGYYNHATRLRVESLFRCEHPVLGSAAKGELSPEEIFQIGRKMGKAAQQH